MALAYKEGMTREESQEVNRALFEKLASRDHGMEKEAEDIVNEFTRTKMREDGYMRRLMPPVPISNDELDRQATTDKPVKVVDKEPDSPAAISIPFATLPMNLYIRGPRYLVMMERIATPRFTKDTSELRTWIMDIRQVLSDNAIKDMLAEEDSKFTIAFNQAVGGAQGAIVPTSGVAQWVKMVGGMTRDSVCDMLKIMRSTPSHLSTKTCLINDITVLDLMKWGRTEMGGDLSQDVMKKGWTLQEFAGVNWMVTIKWELCPTGTVMMFADPKFIGKHYTLEDVTMYIRREAFMLEFFAYEENGATFGHTSGLARADFV